MIPAFQYTIFSDNLYNRYFRLVSKEFRAITDDCIPELRIAADVWLAKGHMFPSLNSLILLPNKGYFGSEEKQHSKPNKSLKSLSLRCLFENWMTILLPLLFPQVTGISIHWHPGVSSTQIVAAAADFSLFVRIALPRFQCLQQIIIYDFINEDGPLIRLPRLPSSVRSLWLQYADCFDLLDFDWSSSFVEDLHLHYAGDGVHSSVIAGIGECAHSLKKLTLKNALCYVYDTDHDQTGDVTLPDDSFGGLEVLCLVDSHLPAMTPGAFPKLQNLKCSFLGIPDEEVEYCKAQLGQLFTLDSRANFTEVRITCADNLTLEYPLLSQFLEMPCLTTLDVRVPYWWHTKFTSAFLNVAFRLPQPNLTLELGCGGDTFDISLVIALAHTPNIKRLVLSGTYKGPWNDVLMGVVDTDCIVQRRGDPRTLEELAELERDQDLHQIDIESDID